MEACTNADGKSVPLKETLELANKAAKEFINLYYKMYQNSRHTLDRIYHESANMLYRGNLVQGSEKITRFIQDLPICQFVIDTLDCQPVSKDFTSGKETLLLSVSGTVKYENHPLQAFTQHFMLFNEKQHWKILNDCIRIHDP